MISKPEWRYFALWLTFLVQTCALSADQAFSVFRLRDCGQGVSHSYDWMIDWCFRLLAWNEMEPLVFKANAGDREGGEQVN